MDNEINLYQLKNTWKLLYHYDKDNWKLSGYRWLYSINTPGDFWKFYNNWEKLYGSITYKHIFLIHHFITCQYLFIKFFWFQSFC